VTADLLLHLLARFLHISSAIVLLGGIFYARQVMVPVVNEYAGGSRAASYTASLRRFQGALYGALGLLVVSGLYNLLTGPKHTRDYHTWFGIKMLLVLHVLATAILWSTSPGSERSSRRLLSLTISGFLVVLISSYLRSLSQRGL
jgi:uncharacterized membrane protein